MTAQARPKNTAKTPAILLLAAGMGKRMRSALPKVLHDLGGEPILVHVLQRIAEVAPQSPVGIVVGHQRELVEETIRKHPISKILEIDFIVQAEQKGTGHATRVAMDSEWGKRLKKNKQNILVLPGDTPLITNEMLTQLLAPLNETTKGAVIRLLTTELPDPTGYGRVVRRKQDGPVLRIAEEKDANSRERAIREVALSIYLFDSAFLAFGLAHLRNQNAQGEYYLTDLIAEAARTRKKIEVLQWKNSEDLRGINDPWDLAVARKSLNERCVRSWALRGVKFTDPWTCWIQVSVELEEDVVIAPGVVLSGNTKIKKGATIGPRCVLKNVVVGERANIKTGTVAEDSEIGEDVQLGPYAHLRPESKVGKKSKIGNFVELKKTVIGESTSVAHLSYLGDAVVGDRVNIGCGFVTCNFDGRVIDGSRKHKTVIGDDVFLGSDCQVVAPCTLGEGAYIASGSTITQNVEAGALAIARSRQVNKPGYARRFNPNLGKKG